METIVHLCVLLLLLSALYLLLGLLAMAVERLPSLLARRRRSARRHGAKRAPPRRERPRRRAPERPLPADAAATNRGLACRVP